MFSCVYRINAGCSFVKMLTVAACMNIALMAGLANTVLKKQVSTSPRLDRDEGQQEHLLYPNTHSGQMKLPEAGVAGP